MTSPAPTEAEHRFGYFFEDLHVGQTFTSDGRTVTEADVVAFAGVSGDFNPIHLDANAAQESRFRQRLAHGILGLSMATGFIDSLGVFRRSMIAMLQIDKWCFLAPIFIGDSIHLVMTIDDLRLTSTGDRGVVRRRLELINQAGVIVQRGVITVLISTRPDAGRQG